MMNSVVSINKLDLTSQPGNTCKGGNSACSDPASDESDQEEPDFKLPGITDLEPEDFDISGRKDVEMEADELDIDRTRESKL